MLEPLFPALPAVESTMNLKKMLHDIELACIQDALNKANGVVSQAARKLGVKRTTLIEKMKKYGIGK